MVEGSGKFEDVLGALIVEYKGQRLGVKGQALQMHSAIYLE